MSQKIKTMKEIVTILEEKLGTERFVVISTDKYDLTTKPNGRNNRRDRSNWADEVVEMLFKKKREEIEKRYPRRLGTGEYNFSYIKLAVNKNNEIFGVVHGKSSFHCMYPSDVWFYDLDDSRKDKLKELFIKNGLRWYMEKIIIIKNKDVFSYKEAYENEKEIREWLHTFD